MVVLSWAISPLRRVHSETQNVLHRPVLAIGQTTPQVRAL